jgi:predicted ATPase/DNA-binding XRE family transcriptional regulator
MPESISFGAWLRQQRRLLDLTQKAFADRAGCAEITVRRMEADKYKPSNELALVLFEKLGIPEPERPQWVRFARGLSNLPLQSILSSTKSITNLPAPLTTFIGREKEQSDVTKLVTKNRLVTLTGSGGVGKTRLAIKVGEQILGNHADGVWIVELAPILDPALVPRTTAIAIGLRDEPQRSVIDMLSDYLRAKEMLIILDNCEHLLEACAQLADSLLKRCPELKILVTSREMLGILGEAVYHVPSLGLPDLQQLLEKFKDYESVRLFEERAQLAQMNFSLKIENASAVAKICTYLDGIPLAIELAAARVSTFSTQQIEERLQESFNLLTTGNRTALPRHQTLQAAIDWSYDLLSLAEQTLFRRLSVFVNGWTLEAAESICSDTNIKSESISDLLIQLINKSLVVTHEEHGKTRYKMLGTIRQYAGEKLDRSGERDALCDRHLEYFLYLAETAAPHLIRPEQLEWLSLLDADYENLRLALEWALSKETAESSLRLSGALGLFWEIRCSWSEGLTWLTRALGKPIRDASMSQRVARSRALAMKAYLDIGNPEEILSAGEASLALALEVADKKDIAIARCLVGHALMLGGREKDRAYFLLEQSSAAFQVLNEPFWHLLSYHDLGVLLAREGRLKFRDLNRQCVQLARKTGERVALAEALLNYAYWLFRDNQVDKAMQHAEEAAGLYRQVEPKRSSTSYLMFAKIALENGDYQKAKSFYLEMLEHYRVLGVPYSICLCLSNLGLIAMEEHDLDGGQAFFEQGLSFARTAGIKFFIVENLIHLSNLFYLKGAFEEFKQRFREGILLKEYLDKAQKAWILMTMLGSLHVQKPAASAKLLGVIDSYEREDYFLFAGREKRYCIPAEAHGREVLGDAIFEFAFTEGQKLSLDEGLDVAFKTVEEM